MRCYALVHERTDAKQTCIEIGRLWRDVGRVDLLERGMFFTGGQAVARLRAITPQCRRSSGTAEANLRLFSESDRGGPGCAGRIIEAEFFVA